MAQSQIRVWLTEGIAVVGLAFGAWLIHNSFQATSDLPAGAPLMLGVLDIFLCFMMLGYFLRRRLRAAEGLPRRWIVGTVVLVCAFLGWIAALFLDSNRLMAEEDLHADFSVQLARFEDSVRRMGEAMATTGMVDRHTWDLNQGQYVRLHDQLQAALRGRSDWNQDLTRVNEQARLMQKAYAALPVENVAEQRLRLRGDFLLARDRAVQQTESLRVEVAQSQRDTIALRRARWHGVGAASLTGFIVILGCLSLGLVFHRELRRCWNNLANLAEAEARFRSLVENDPQPLAALDSAAAIVYANSAWQTKFGLEPRDLVGTPLLELVHPDDRARILVAMQSQTPQERLACRLRADYGVWHDIEVSWGIDPERGVLILRIQHLRETSELPQLRMSA